MTQVAPPKIQPNKDQLKKKTEPVEVLKVPEPAKIETTKKSASPIKKGKTPQNKEIKKAEVIPKETLAEEIKGPNPQVANLFQGTNPFLSFKKQFKDI